MPTFPSPEWLDAYREAIASDDGFRAVASDWEGDICLVVTAEPERNVTFDSWAWFDLRGGADPEVRTVTQDEGERARFVIAAPYSTWKEVLQGRLEPLRGMTQGQLRLSGDLVALREHVDVVGALVSLASTVPTEFPDA